MLPLWITLDPLICVLVHFYFSLPTFFPLLFFCFTCTPARCVAVNVSRFSSTNDCFDPERVRCAWCISRLPLSDASNGTIANGTLYEQF